MLGLFKNSNPQCPVSEETRKWIERCFIWFTQNFGHDIIKNKKIFTPEYSNFPIKYNSDQQAATDTLKIIADQMEIDTNEVQLDIYAEGQVEVDTGSSLNRIFMRNVENEKYSAGQYIDKKDDNKYHIGLEIKIMNQPLDLIATLAHELAHIKLLGEKRISENNEGLTDLATIIFGFGIFGANAAFQAKTNFDSWGWSNMGYLSQMEWGYALALFSYMKDEENPDWIKYLSRNVKSDFIQSTKFIRSNQDKIFTHMGYQSEDENKEDADPVS